MVRCGCRGEGRRRERRRRGGGCGEAKLGEPMTKEKFAEVELSLLDLQQNVEIPETIWFFILLFNRLLSWWALSSFGDDVSLT